MAPTTMPGASGPVALLVAAGSGERLGHGRPKALVEVAGRTLLEWSLAALRRYLAVALGVGGSEVLGGRRVVPVRPQMHVVVGQHSCVSGSHAR